MNEKEIADKRLHSSCQWISFAEREDWLELRKQGIGGSDVAGIFNESPFSDRRKVWLSKQKDFKPEELSNSAINFGNNMEVLIFNIFKYKYNAIYETLDYKNILFRNYFTDFFQASVDGILVKRNTKEVGILEIKTVQPSAIHNWYDAKGKPITPKYYMYQVLHYLNTLDLDFIVIYVLANTENEDTSMRFLQPRIYERKKLTKELEKVSAECVDFWLNYVLKGKEPGIKL